MNPKVYCFYLPQYHTFPENDNWWGKGFTEWTNVVKESPRFQGHHQPQLPADMGFYDLRVSETRVKQGELAKEYGIDGFIYYHYWFHGKRLMNKPFDDMFMNKSETFPFALCWANETWTRAWDGQEREILIKQEYSEQDDIEHIEFLVDKFHDDRYIKVDGNPLFLTYRLGNHPYPGRFIKLLRNKARDCGFEDVHFCGVKSSFSQEVNNKILALDVDAFVDFQPNSEHFPSKKNLMTKTYDLAKSILPDSLYQTIKLKVSANKIISYKAMVEEQVGRTYDYHSRVYPCVFPSWDNSARRASATIIQNNSESVFSDWINVAFRHLDTYETGEKILFINAWNEWAEGCHLEPDLKNKDKFLSAVKKCKKDIEC